MTQKRRKADSGKAIREITALRWEPTHITKPSPRIVLLQATFQAMINKILRDLINEEKVVAFVDNVLVGTEIEEGHDKIVEEILERLEENNLYIKPEKYVWKV